MSRKWKLVLATSFAAVSVLFCLGMVVPIVTTNEYICRECGLHRFVASTTLGGIRKYVTEDCLYRWWRRRVNREHEHDYVRVWRVIRTVLGQQRSIYDRDGMLRRCSSLGKLEKLERVGLDPELYRELLHQDSERQDAARNALEHLEVGLDDAETRAWWENPRRYLDTPSAWPAGFRQFR